MKTNNGLDNTVLSCQNIIKTYNDGAGELSVLDNVTLTLQKGEKMAIVGASGSGKSSLLHILGGLDLPTSGIVTLQNQPFSDLGGAQQAKLRNSELGFIYQFHHLLNEFTAIENVTMPLRIAKMNKKMATEKATDALEKVGLAHRLYHRPNALSGGERQRVAIARAIVNEPSVLLADEPTGNLDSRAGLQIYQLLLDIQIETHMAFIIVTHDLSLATKMDRTLTLVNGKLRQE